MATSTTTTAPIDYRYATPLQLLKASNATNTKLLYLPRDDEGSFNNERLLLSSARFPQLKEFPTFPFHVTLKPATEDSDPLSVEENLQTKLQCKGYSIVYTVGVPGVLYEAIDCFRFQFYSYVSKEEQHLPIYSFYTRQEAEFFKHLVFNRKRKLFSAFSCRIDNTFVFDFGQNFYVFDIATNLFYRAELNKPATYRVHGESREFDRFAVLRPEQQAIQPLLYASTVLKLQLIRDIFCSEKTRFICRSTLEDNDVPFIDSELEDYITFSSFYFKPKFLAFSISSLVDYIRRAAVNVDFVVYSNNAELLAAGTEFDVRLLPTPFEVANNAIQNLKRQEADYFLENDV